MTPDQFLEFAGVFPEPLLLVTVHGEILAMNQAVAKLLNCHRKELQKKTLLDLVVDPADQVINYLQACARNRQFVLGSLTFLLPNNQTLICRAEGGVMQPDSSADSPALIILRLENRSSASLDFVLLNQKIDELSQEIHRRQQVEAKLVKQNLELEEAFRQLKNTQLKLIQTEKMSSLGHLVAGVAHEINNPVTFIHGNLSHVEEYFKKLLELVKLYQTEYPAPSPNIQAYEEEIDFEFIWQDIDSLISSMRGGTQRILEIVKSLRNFSRLGEADAKVVDIHEGIESTLVLLRNRLQTSLCGGQIEVIRNYGDLPLIYCYPGQLNQVFMSLISNAIDALVEAEKKRTLEEVREKRSQIRIVTRKISSDMVSISIQDNGLGISDRDYPHIFNPFFTTKPVGQGTGLGLAISYQIVTQLHQGRLICNSTPPYGSEFRVEIPIARPAAKPQQLQRLNNFFFVI